MGSHSTTNKGKKKNGGVCHVTVACAMCQLATDLLARPAVQKKHPHYCHHVLEKKGSLGRPFKTTRDKKHHNPEAGKPTRGAGAAGPCLCCRAHVQVQSIRQAGRPSVGALHRSSAPKQWLCPGLATSAASRDLPHPMLQGGHISYSQSLPATGGSGRPKCNPRPCRNLSCSRGSLCARPG
jgi:hypothetical protein